jgi:processive 1,2-diacylglycerol beta-glucosyltransferase
VKKVNIFHISEFGGHNKAAQNLKEALLHRYPEIEVATVNGLGYFYPRAEKVINFIYITVIKYFPRFWRKHYDRGKTVKALTPCRGIVHRLTFGRLNKFIKEQQPDCAVATQAFPCGLIADFKERYGLKIPLIAIVTDYHPHRFWVHPLVDRYVVACEEAKEALIEQGVDPDKVKILGIPISLKFLSTYPKEQISDEFNFIKDLDSILIMGGGLGIGPLKVIAKKLDSLPCNFQTIVVCGRNKGLYKWFIKRKHEFKKPIFIFSYTDDMHKIMDFSDMIITKAGGVTISEALAKELCIIVTNPIPGQEERNVEYLSRRKAIVKSDNLERVAKIVNDFLQDKEKLHSLKGKAKENSFIDSSLKIVDLIAELTD